MVDECPDYTSAGKSSALALKRLRNPNIVKETGAFTITFFDKTGNKIAETVALPALTFTAQPGKCIPTGQTSKINNAVPCEKMVTLTNLGKFKVAEKTNLKLTFTPQHKLTAESTFSVKFPPQIKPTCNFVD